MVSNAALLCRLCPLVKKTVLESLIPKLSSTLGSSIAGTAQFKTEEICRRSKENIAAIVGNLKENAEISTCRHS